MEIKLMINKKNNRVMYAEARKEFVDLLVSILTLPLGSIEKLGLLYHPSSSKSFISKLYSSVQNLPDFVMRSDKSILLDPKVVSTTYTSEILNIQSSPKYYICNNSSSRDYKHSISTQSHIVRCPCGHIVNRQVNLVGSALEPKPGPDLETEPGYVKKSANFVITDDLSIISVNSTATIVNLWKKIGIKEPTEMEERNISVGANQVTALLRAAMVSNTALNDVFRSHILSGAKTP